MLHCLAFLLKEKLVGKIRLPHQAEVVVPEELNESICRDKDDLGVIGTALSGNAGFIITGDEDLLILKKYKDIEMVTPREFWERLRG